MNPLIFFGAGEYALTHLDQYKDAGITPVCFVDNDVSRHNTFFGEKKVLSLESALQLYPSCDILITSSDYFDPICDCLLNNGINKGRILNFSEVGTSDFKVPGCHAGLLGNFMLFRDDRIAACCYQNAPYMLRTGNLDYDIEAFREYINNIIYAHKCGNVTSCHTCDKFKPYSGYVKQEQIYIDFGDLLGGGKCNFKCIYCGVKNSVRESKDGLTALKILQYAENKWDSLKLNYVNGEIALNPDCNKIIDIIKKKRYFTTIYTNASVYVEGIADLLREKLARIVVSNDSGTRETFLRIKQVDCYDAVVKNLEKYVLTGGEVYLKYIFMPGINDNVTDVDNFCALVERLSIPMLISGNLADRFSRFPEHTLEMAIHLARLGKEKQIAVGFDVWCMSEYDVKTIKDMALK